MMLLLLLLLPSLLWSLSLPLSLSLSSFGRTTTTTTERRTSSSFTPHSRKFRTPPPSTSTAAAIVTPPTATATTSTPASHRRLKLPSPTVIYSDNHLLIMNKPAGWHSVPNISNKKKKKQQQRQRNQQQVQQQNNSNNHNHNTDTETNNTDTEERKCLLTYLKKKHLGGGSRHDFLQPLHRIDQPCTGIICFGKTSKATSRITTLWKKNTTTTTPTKKKKNYHPPPVTKEYLCVVPTSRLDALEEASTSMTNASMTNTHSWQSLEGMMIKKSSYSIEKERRGRDHQQGYRDRDRPKSKGRSVYIVRHKKHCRDNDSDVESENESENIGISNNSQIRQQQRPVGITWRRIRDNDTDDYTIVVVPNTTGMKTRNKKLLHPEFTLLLVRTSEGARHMVRALLAQVGNCPIIGDVRYWVGPRTTTSTTTIHNYHKNNNDNDEYTMEDQYSKKTLSPSSMLPDRSVALHAYGLSFDKTQLTLGTLSQFEFRAPIPSTWKLYFGLDPHRIQK
mmetsp:Transcript_25506/g.27373  ORF Transcript_25506/g.27373 Transcript_25506/m.27373 type:complete len:506 (-) Transcript_25506:231-1748(-)